LQPQAGSAAPAMSKTVAGRRYTFEANPQNIEALALDALDSQRATVTVRMNGSDQTITATSGAWQKGTLTLGGRAEAIAASGGWTAADTFTLQVVRYRTPFSTTYRFGFADGQVTVDSEQNVGPANARTAQLIGKLEVPVR
jgi:hypothetical protein